MEDTQGTSLKPPFLLSLLCVFSFVFFGIISLLFLISLFYSGSIIRIINEYIPERSVAPIQVILIVIAGFLLHSAAFTGTVLMLKMKKTGYILFGISVLIICLYQLFQDKISLFTTLFYIILIILFGLFYKKFR
jgi:hypothetical protein